MRDKDVKKLLDTNKIIQAAIEKIRKVVFSPVPDSEKITKVESIILWTRWMLIKKLQNTVFYSNARRLELIDDTALTPDAI